MNNIGWEIRPLGWLLVIVVLAVLGYVAVTHFWRFLPASGTEA
jgi:hypothetical protein